MDLSNSYYLIVIFVGLAGIWLVSDVLGVQLIATIILLFQFAILYSLIYKEQQQCLR